MKLMLCKKYFKFCKRPYCRNLTVVTNPTVTWWWMLVTRRKAGPVGALSTASTAASAAQGRTAGPALTAGTALPQTSPRPPAPPPHSSTKRATSPGLRVASPARLTTGHRDRRRRHRREDRPTGPRVCLAQGPIRTQGWVCALPVILSSFRPVELMPQEDILPDHLW